MKQIVPAKSHVRARLTDKSSRAMRDVDVITAPGITRRYVRINIHGDVVEVVAADLIAAIQTAIGEDHQHGLGSP